MSNPKFEVIEGDCRQAMKSLVESSVDSVVTDPPYELGFMGKGWDRSGIAYDVSVWRECLRVLKPGAHLLAFGGSRTYHRLACAIEDAGFEIRDQIQWLYGSGFPKSLDVSKAIDAAAGAARQVVGVSAYSSRRPQTAIKEGVFSNQGPNLGGPGSCDLSAPATDAAKQWSGWGTALKPAHEPIVLARKPLIGTVAENVLRHGTGGLNIDRCRIDDVGIGMFGSKRRARGAIDGRWPANVIHDGSDEVISSFPDSTSEGGLNPIKNPHSIGTFEEKIQRPFFNYGDSGSAARFFYCPKASKGDREDGLISLPVRSAGQVTDRKDGSDGLNSPRAGAGRNNGSRNHHPTVKPTQLMRYLCRLITPPKGLILDPFCGSGSTGRGAVSEQFNFIGIDLSAEYCELARLRIEAAIEEQGSLFDVES